MAGRKPYVRVKRERGYLEDKRLPAVTTISADPSFVHSEGLKPYRSRAAGGDFNSMELLTPGIYTFPYDQPRTENPEISDQCTGTASVMATANPVKMFCDDPGAALSVTGFDRDGKAIENAVWDFTFPTLSPVGRVINGSGSGGSYIPPTCAELFADSGCFGTSENLAVYVTLCDGTPLLSTVIVDIQQTPAGVLNISGPAEASIGSVYSVLTSVGTGPITYSVSAGAINSVTGQITAVDCGTAIVSAVAECRSNAIASKTIRWADTSLSKWIKITDCNTCPSSGSSSGECCSRGTIISGAFKSQIRDRGCNTIIGCTCADSSSGHPCTQCPDDTCGGCPLDEPSGCLADSFGRTKDAAHIIEWQWCCNAGC